MTDHIKDAILEFIKNNDGEKDRVDVVSHMGLTANVVYPLIKELIKEDKIKMEMKSRKTMKPLGWMGVCLGIGWIWLLCVLWTFIDIDGWILYPIGFTSLFIMVCASIIWLIKIDDFYECHICKVNFDKEEEPPYIIEGSYEPNRYFCPRCNKSLKIEQKENEKEKED